MNKHNFKTILEERKNRREAIYKKRYGENWKELMFKDFEKNKNKAIISELIMKSSHEELIDYIYNLKFKI